MRSENIYDDDHRADLWAGDEDVENIEAARQLSAQYELFSEDVADGPTVTGRDPVFTTHSSHLRQLLLSATPYRSMSSEKAFAAFVLTPGKLSCRMSHGSICISSMLMINDEKAVSPESAVAFEYPLPLVYRLSLADAQFVHRIYSHKAMWSIRENRRKLALRLTSKTVRHVDVEPWAVGDRGGAVKIDPEALGRALSFASIGADKKGTSPQYALVEVRAGMACGGGPEAITTVAGEALNGITFKIAAMDVHLACRILRRMDPAATYLAVSSEFQFITSGALEMAVRTPRLRLPSDYDRLLRFEGTAIGSIACDPFALHLFLGQAALQVRGQALELQVTQSSPMSLQWQATSNRGRFLTASLTTLPTELGASDRRAETRGDELVPGARVETGASKAETGKDENCGGSRDDQGDAGVRPASTDDPEDGARARSGYAVPALGLPSEFALRLNFEIVNKLLGTMLEAETVAITRGKKWASFETRLRGLQYRAMLPTVGEPV